MQNLRDVHFRSLPIAVLDFETTGLSANYERVGQASVVHLNAQGSPVMAMDTLINPKRRIEIADDLLQVLEGRVKSESR